MDKANVIKKQLDKAGRCVYLKDGEWISTPVRAVISHLWRKKSTAFEPKYTELGVSGDEYYLYIGPYNHDITSLTNNAVLLVDNERYGFKRADAVFFGKEVIYYTGILKRFTGDDTGEN